MEPRILLVCPPGRREQLVQCLDGKGFHLFIAHDYEDACEKLSGALRYELLFVDAELTDRRWQDVLDWTRSLGAATTIVVCARLGDERLWAKALESGAYDVIAEPYEERENGRILDAALRAAQLRCS